MKNLQQGSGYGVFCSRKESVSWHHDHYRRVPNLYLMYNIYAGQYSLRTICLEYNLFCQTYA